jgi:hypothetical protein
MSLMKIISENSNTGMYLVEMPKSVVDALRPGLSGAGGTIEADPSALAVLTEIRKIGDWFASMQRTLDKLPDQIAERVEGIFEKLDSIDEDVTGIMTALNKAKRAAKRKQIAAGAVEPPEGEGG